MPDDQQSHGKRRALVAGWFSFEDGHATAGDLMARDLICNWLDEIGWTYDVAVAPPFSGGVSWTEADENLYSHVVFVCGPFGPDRNERAFFRKFWRCRTIGLNLSMKVPLDEWNPFDLLIERNSTRHVNPDLVFGAPKCTVPLVGVCRVEDYPEGMTDAANALMDKLLANRSCARVEIDTRLDANTTGLRSPEEVETVLAGMDVVVTTRLHAMVLALRNAVPVVAIDPEAGGAKIIRQACLIGWKSAFPVDSVTDTEIADAFDYCLTDDARKDAVACSRRAALMVNEIKGSLFVSVNDGSVEDAYRSRLNSSHPPELLAESQGGQRISAVIPDLFRRGIGILKPRR